MPIPNLGRGGLPVYAPSSSSATATNGSRNVSFTGTALVTTDATTGAQTYSAGVGDSFVVSGIGAKLIESITDATHLVLVEPWNYATQTSSVNWYIIRNSVPAFGYTAKAIQDVLSVGSTTTPASSFTVDDGTARIQLSSNSGSPGLLVGPSGGPLVPGIVFTTAGVASFPSGIVLPGPSPVLYTYDFIASPSLPATLALTRSTTATYFNSSGVIATAAINAPRFEYSYNGSTWVGVGLLLEEARTNYATPSATFAAWNNGGITPVSASTTNPDSSANTTTQAPNTLANPSYYEAISAGGFSGPAVWYIFAKAKEYTKAYLRTEDAVGTNSAKIGVLNLLTGVTVFANAGITPSAKDVGNGWFRIAANRSISSGATQYFFQFGPCDDAFSASVDGVMTLGSFDVTKGVWFWGAQQERATFPTSYIPTVSGTATRNVDVLTATSSVITGTSTLISYLAAGPSVWEFTDLATGVTARQSFAAGTFGFPVNKLYRSFAVYPPGTSTSAYMTVGGPY